MNFIKNIFASALGFIMAISILFFITLIIVISSVASATSELEEHQEIENFNTVLKLDLSMDIRDYEGEFAIPELGFEIPKQVQDIQGVINLIKQAKTDDHIKGILLTNHELGISYASTKSIRDALSDFKTSQKFVYAYADRYSQKAYYLASIADTIMVNHMGGIDLRGLASEVLYLKKFQDKTGIHMNVIRHGKYKSAVEPFLSDQMSKENRAQISELQDGIWNTIATDMCQSRELTLPQINKITNEYKARNAKTALESKLIDGVVYADEFEKLLQQKLGVKNIDDYDLLDIRDYFIASSIDDDDDEDKSKIAIIYAQGNIVYGKGNPNTINKDVMHRAFRKALKNKKVKGIVLRIDSPGGDVLSSDIIWREVIEAKKKKPVYVSMGSVAASGGYYISCAADKIFAQQTTITGSIGVFSIMPDIKKLSKEMGVTPQEVTTHRYAIGGSLFSGMNSSTQELIKEDIEDIYHEFVSKVAEGRAMTYEQVHEIAQGRVWTGNQALKIGLIDGIGGLNDVITELAKDLNISDYDKIQLPVYQLDIQDIIDNLSMISVQSILKKELGSKLYEKLSLLKQPMLSEERYQAVLPYDITFD